MPRGINQVFPFFADAKNLERLTPPWLNFNVLSSSTPEIGQGTTIDYKLRLRGIPLRWQSVIEEWEFGKKFVDRQVRGPYALWHHTHTFLEGDEGTWMLDEVRYYLPGGALGNALGRPFVKRDLAKIFEYRSRVVSALFN